MPAKSSELMDVFPALRTAGAPQFLSLWKYLDASPQRFFSADAYKTYLDSLLQLYASRKEELSRLLHDQRAHLDNAYRHADEICGQGWHDAEIRAQDDYGRLIFIDQELHPAYLRLTEAVFRPLLHIPAHFFPTEPWKRHRGSRPSSNRAGASLQGFRSYSGSVRPLDEKRYRSRRPSPIPRTSSSTKTKKAIDNNLMLMESYGNSTIFWTSAMGSS